MKVQFIHHIVSTVGLSILQQMVGLGRQALIAAFYGLSREFDGYLVVLAVATMFIFNVSSVFDTVAVARLVQIRDREGERAVLAGKQPVVMASIARGHRLCGRPHRRAVSRHADRRRRILTAGTRAGA